MIKRGAACTEIHAARTTNRKVAIRTRATLTTFRDVPWDAPFYLRVGFDSITVDVSRPELAKLRALNSIELDLAHLNAGNVTRMYPQLHSGDNRSPRFSNCAVRKMGSCGPPLTLDHHLWFHVRALVRPPSLSRTSAHRHAIDGLRCGGTIVAPEPTIALLDPASIAWAVSGR